MIYKTNTLDIETFNCIKGKIVPICVCFLIENIFYNEYFIEGKDIILSSLKTIFFKSKNKTIIVYVHNINFDGYLIIESLTKQKELKFKSLIRDNSIYSITIEDNKMSKKIIIKCSYKIIPRSLSNIAEVFKLGEKTIFPHLFSSKENLFYIGEVPEIKYFKNIEEYFYFKKNIINFNFKECILEYCKNDLIITSKFVEIIEEISKKKGINLDTIFSSPSLSIKIFIKNYSKNKISFNLKSTEKKMIKNSYFGGRCEVYGNPSTKEKIFHYDFTGMYAQCMTEKFPYGKCYIIENPKNLTIPGFYYIEYFSDNFIPVLPHRSNIDNKLMFTNGLNKGFFWFEEINLFINMGGIIKNIELGLIYDKYDYLFKDFVDDFMELRKENDIMNTFGKLVINSLYGRLGMNDMNNEILIIEKNQFEEIYASIKKKIFSFNIVNDCVIIDMKTDKKIRVKGNVTLASSITSKARIKLYNAQQDVLKNKGKLLYSDTDSVYACYDEDVSKEKHGILDWSNDKKRIKDGVFISSKTYAIKYEDGSESVKIKGFDNKLIDFNELKNKFYNKKDFLNFENKYISKKNMEMFSIENTKNLNLKSYTKRKFSEDLLFTEPLIYKNFDKYE